MKRVSLIGISFLMTIMIGCTRKSAVYDDCIRNESEQYFLCITDTDAKARMLKVIKEDTKEIVYEKSLANGGNAVWFSNSIIEVQVFSGYDEQPGKYYFDVEKGEITSADRIRE